MRGRILVVDEKTPTPDQDSGSECTFTQLGILVRAGFEVTFVPATLARHGRYTRALNRIGVATPRDRRWHSLGAAIQALSPKSDAVLLYRAPVAALVFDIVRRAAPKAKIVFHTVDLHFLRMERGATLTGDPAQAKLAAVMRREELKLVAYADATIVVSSHEAALLADIARGAAVHHVPILRQVPPLLQEFSGWRRIYDHLPEPLRAFSRPKVAEHRPGPDKRRDVLFIGSFHHAPNVDGVLWFAREVWPRLQRRGFQGKFIVVGSNAPDEIGALASGRIEIRGYVRDLAPLFDGCRLSVAPLRYGGGVKGKIVTSLSYGVPVVATSIAAEGMGLRHAVDILVADDPEEMAERIIDLYGDDDLWRRLSANGHEAFTNIFSEAAGAAKFLTLFDSLIG